MDREHEHIPEASETSGWEIAADAVVVQVEAGLQEYVRSQIRQKSHRVSQLALPIGKKRQADFCAGHTGGIEGEAGD